LKAEKPTATLPEAEGRLLALDLGSKRVGVAVSDELRISVRALAPIERRSWKDLLRRVTHLIASYDAQGLVIGLPLNIDGTDGPSAVEARQTAEKFRRSLAVHVYLQDERLTSLAATEELRATGLSSSEIKQEVDSRSATLILNDFVSRLRQKF
jgi:putative holliday junction resolvase